MADKSKIEWTDASWGPVTGCEKTSAGCKFCYAERDWPRLSANPATIYFGRKFTDVRCHPERLDQPLRWQKPRKIFVNSMSDLFHPDVPFDFIDQVFAVMALAPRHTFQILTKRPERMLQYLSMEDERRQKIAGWIKGNLKRCFPENAYLNTWPLPNVWLGVSIENQEAADKRIPLLLQVPASVRWLSIEPLIGPVSLRWLAAWNGKGFKPDANETDHLDGLRCLDWVVVGGESGHKARPMHPDWARNLRDQCKEAGVPFNFKQWGEWVPRGPESMGYPLVEDVPRIRLTDTGENGQDLASSGGNHSWMQRVGKKVAGRLLDGKLYDEYPGGSK